MREVTKKLVISCIVLSCVFGVTMPVHAADERESAATVCCTDATHAHTVATNSISTFATVPQCTRCKTNKWVVPHGLVCYVCMKCGTYMWA